MENFLNSYDLDRFCFSVSGFMCGTTVLDKDGISAAVVVAEMAAYLNSEGIRILQQLENIHNK